MIPVDLRIVQSANRGKRTIERLARLVSIGLVQGKVGPHGRQYQGQELCVLNDFGGCAIQLPQPVHQLLIRQYAERITIEMFNQIGSDTTRCNEMNR